MKSVHVIVNLPGEAAGTLEYTFNQPSHFLVGRASDCDIRIPPETVFEGVSRHHCEFEINPPTVVLRDLGSRNGTFVNGVPIGHRPESTRDLEETGRLGTERELHDQDEVRIGDVTLRVEIHEGDPNSAIACIQRARQEGQEGVSVTQCIR